MQAPSVPLVRVAHAAGAIYLDLANPDDQIIQVTAEGWRILTPPPPPEPGADGLTTTATSHDAEESDSPPLPHFLRPHGQLPLPAPKPMPPELSGLPEGALGILRPLVNLPNNRDWVLFLAWLIGALRPGQPCPILALTGEQGTGKTTLARIARALIDPHEVPLHAPPRQPRDLAKAAAGGWIAAFDNLSAIPPSMADGLARMVSGGGFSTGQHDDDAQPTLFEARRPVIINGIDDLATRSDLLDRCIVLRLPPIPARRRMGEAELWDRFEAARPYVLGALLDGVSTGLANAPEVDLASKPRMADFALWVTAAEPAMPWRPGAFLAAYGANRQQAACRAMESSPLAQAILGSMSYDDEDICIDEEVEIERNNVWKGTMGELYSKLTRALNRRRERGKFAAGLNPRKLGIELRRLAPTLRAMGVDLAFGPHTRRGNTITLTYIEIPDETAHAPAPPAPPDAKEGSQQALSSRQNARGVHIHT